MSVTGDVEVIWKCDEDDGWPAAISAAPL